NGHCYGSEHSAAQKVPRQMARFAAAPSGYVGSMKRLLIVAASVLLAAAKTWLRQGPLACVGGELEVTQVSGFVPHQQGSGSPPPPVAPPTPVAPPPPPDVPPALDPPPTPVMPPVPASVPPSWPVASRQATVVTALLAQVPSFTENVRVVVPTVVQVKVVRSA